MRVLALETSQPAASLAALSVGETAVSVVRNALLPDEQRTAQALLPTLGELLSACGWSPRNLDLICVTTGPGSFTGLRIGVTTAKTFAYSTGAELVGVNTLTAIVAGAGLPPIPVWSLLDAQRQEVFAARFDLRWRDDSASHPRVELLSNDAWLARVQAGEGVCGPPLAKLAERLPRGATIAASECWAPRAEMVGRLGIAAHARGEAVDPMQLSPNYYRRSAAEEKAAARDGA